MKAAPGGRPRKKPGRLWLFFYGRRRRGFPWLLVGLGAAVLALGALFGAPGGPDLSRWVTALSVLALVVLVVASLVVVLVAFLRPRGRR